MGRRRIVEPRWVRVGDLEPDDVIETSRAMMSQVPTRPGYHTDQALVLDVVHEELHFQHVKARGPLVEEFVKTLGPTGIGVLLGFTPKMRVRAGVRKYPGREDEPFLLAIPSADLNNAEVRRAWVVLDRYETVRMQLIQNDYSSSPRERVVELPPMGESGDLTEE